MKVFITLQQYKEELSQSIFTLILILLENEAIGFELYKYEGERIGTKVIPRMEAANFGMMFYLG